VAPSPSTEMTDGLEEADYCDDCDAVKGFAPEEEEGPASREAVFGLLMAMVVDVLLFSKIVSWCSRRRRKSDVLVTEEECLFEQGQRVDGELSAEEAETEEKGIVAEETTLVLEAVATQKQESAERASAEAAKAAADAEANERSEAEERAASEAVEDMRIAAVFEACQRREAEELARAKDSKFAAEAEAKERLEAEERAAAETRSAEDAIFAAKAEAAKASADEAKAKHESDERAVADEKAAEDARLPAEAEAKMREETEAEAQEKQQAEDYAASEAIATEQVRPAAEVEAATFAAEEDSRRKQQAEVHAAPTVRHHVAEADEIRRVAEAEAEEARLALKVEAMKKRDAVEANQVVAEERVAAEAAKAMGDAEANEWSKALVVEETRNTEDVEARTQPEAEEWAVAEAFNEAAEAEAETKERCETEERAAAESRSAEDAIFVAEAEAIQKRDEEDHSAAEEARAAAEAEATTQRESEERAEAEATAVEEARLFAEAAAKRRQEAEAERQEKREAQDKARLAAEVEAAKLAADEDARRKQEAEGHAADATATAQARAAQVAIKKRKRIVKRYMFVGNSKNIDRSRKLRHLVNHMVSKLRKKVSFTAQMDSDERLAEDKAAVELIEAERRRFAEESAAADAKALEDATLTVVIVAEAKTDAEQLTDTERECTLAAEGDLEQVAEEKAAESIVSEEAQLPAEAGALQDEDVDVAAAKVNRTAEAEVAAEFVAQMQREDEGAPVAFTKLVEGSSFEVYLDSERNEAEVTAAVEHKAFVAHHLHAEQKVLKTDPEVTEEGKLVTEFLPATDPEVERAVAEQTVAEELEAAMAAEAVAKHQAAMVADTQLRQLAEQHVSAELEAIAMEPQEARDAELEAAMAAEVAAKLEAAVVADEMRQFAEHNLSAELDPNAMEMQETMETQEIQTFEMSFATATFGVAAPYDEEPSKHFAFLVPGNEELILGGVGLNGAVGKLLLEYADQPIPFERGSDGKYVMTKDETGRSVPKFHKSHCSYKKTHEAMLQACSELNAAVVGLPSSMPEDPLCMSGARVYCDPSEPMSTAFLHIFKKEHRPFSEKNLALLYTVEPWAKTNVQDFLLEVYLTGANVTQLVVDYNSGLSGDKDVDPSLAAIEAIRLPIVSGDVFIDRDVTPREIALALLWGIHSTLAGAGCDNHVDIELMPGGDMEEAYRLYRSGLQPPDWNTPEFKNIFQKIPPLAHSGAARLHSASWSCNSRSCLSQFSAAPATAQDDHDIAVEYSALPAPSEMPVDPPAELSSPSFVRAAESAELPAQRASLSGSPCCQQSWSAESPGEPASEECCSNYQLDVCGAQYSDCKCGFPKMAHALFNMSPAAATPQKRLRSVGRVSSSPRISAASDAKDAVDLFNYLPIDPSTPVVRKPLTCIEARIANIPMPAGSKRHSWQENSLGNNSPQQEERLRTRPPHRQSF